MRWLLDVITDSPTAEKHRVFRIQNLEVLDTLGLERRQGFRYAIEELLPKLDGVRRTGASGPDDRTGTAGRVREEDSRTATETEPLRHAASSPSVRRRCVRTA